ncbi:hypothetical protein [Nevskia sp.]|uniref:hypothetical protein n=1 Tax=Nevskia sp. TaxID=1929292 RepID=UPI0025ED7220|nr:hypothetical protein [Nevskia sp.]
MADRLPLPVAGLLALLLGAGLPMLAGAQARRAPVQCWNDDRGQKVCGDVVPPSEARRQRELIDQRGVVTRVVPAQKTAAQIEAEAKLRRETEQRIAYDRYLLQAYNAVPDIERARDDRLTDLDSRLRLAEKALADTRASLSDLRLRIPKAAVTIDPRLQARIDEFTIAEADHLKAVARIRQDRARIVLDFARDIVRFRELKGSAGG